jgi:hypothetical protein
MPTRRSTFQGRTCATTDGTKSRDTATRGEQQGHTRGQPRKNRERTEERNWRERQQRPETPSSHLHACAAQSRLRGKGPSCGPWTNAIDENRSVAQDAGNPARWFWLGYIPEGICLGTKHTHNHITHTSTKPPHSGAYIAMADARRLLKPSPVIETPVINIDW